MATQKKMKKISSTKKEEKVDITKPAGERLEDQSLVAEMKESYLDYAMSVIVSRALPDVRDGLKPVHRRILYAMHKLGLHKNAKFRKSATVVGEVIGKYHPHGDSAIYDSMVRMAQDFSMRYPLVNGQGNFGSMDGDKAAAFRYTEAKLEAISDEMLADIEKNTVDFIPTYDGSAKEPSVLPTRLPNLLLNGAMGIAVGMATNVPPHNLNEVCDGAMHLIDNPDATIEDLRQFILGPDFPTGGIIYDSKAITHAYATGKGGIVMRGKAEIQEEKNGQFKIVITEIPYQVNKSALIEKIVELVKTKKIEAVRDLRDESSNKDGVRIVIELKRDVYPKKVLNALYKMTGLQDTFHVNMLALVNGIQPKVLTLKAILEEYIKHRQEVVTRRIQFDLDKAKARAHILEGLKIALDNIDAVIKVIKQSKDKEVARENLIKKFKLSELQAVAILEMRLQQLANLEQQKIENELKEKLKIIKELETILKSPKKILQIIKDEITEIKAKYSSERRTKIVKGAVGEFSAEDFIANEANIVMLTKDGYIKRLAPETFKTQGRGGKGIIGLTTKEEDIIDSFFTTMTHDDMLFFTNRGRAFQLKAYEIPTASRTAKGQAIVNFLQLGPAEKVSAVIPIHEGQKDLAYLIMGTEHGVIKKVAIDQFTKVRKSGLIALKLKDGDTLKWVRPSSGRDEVFFITASGQAIRFKETDVRQMGRGASGVTGIKLRSGDRVVGMNVVNKKILNPSSELLVLTENGYGKRTKLTNYKVQKRGGIGIKTAKITAKTGEIVGTRIVDLKALPEEMKGDIVIISEKGQVIRLAIKGVSALGRATQGVRVMRFKAVADKVSTMTLV